MSRAKPARENALASGRVLIVLLIWIKRTACFLWDWLSYTKMVILQGFPTTEQVFQLVKNEYKEYGK